MQLPFVTLKLARGTTALEVNAPPDHYLVLDVMVNAHRHICISLGFHLLAVVAVAQGGHIRVGQDVVSFGCGFDQLIYLQRCKQYCRTCSFQLKSCWMQDILSMRDETPWWNRSAKSGVGGGFNTRSPSGVFSDRGFNPQSGKWSVYCLIVQKGRNRYRQAEKDWHHSQKQEPALYTSSKSQKQSKGTRHQVSTKTQD